MNDTNDLITSRVLAMSSSEIATLAGKRHDNVLRDIKSMISQVFDLEENSDLSSLEIQGVTVECDGHTKLVKLIQLNKELTLTLTTGYSTKQRHAIIKRWLELEAAVIVPTSFSAALRLAADRQEEVERLEAARLLDAPLIEFAETVSAEAEDIDIATFSKLVTKETGRNLGRNKLLALLRGMGYLASGDVETGLVKNQPYQQYVAQELFTVRYTHDVRGVPHSQTMVTGKGQIRLLSAIRKKLLETGEPSSVIQMADRNQAQ